MESSHEVQHFHNLMLLRLPTGSGFLAMCLRGNTDTLQYKYQFKDGTRDVPLQVPMKFT